MRALDGKGARCASLSHCEPMPDWTRQQRRDIERICRMPGAQGFVARISELKTDDTATIMRRLAPRMLKAMVEALERHEAARAD